VIVMDIDLDQARRRAKELLRRARELDPDALVRMRGDRPPCLADAQRAVAGELGFPSWPSLVEHIAVAAGDRQVRRRRLVAEALAGNRDRVERLLEHDPGLARSGFDVALVLGDRAAVAAALDRRPGIVDEEVEGTGRRPLSCCCHSACLSPESARAAGVVATIELLLDRGASPDEVHHNVFGAMSALYGAAGVANNPDATRLLLARGADPDDGESVYHATEADATTCLELLLDAGATVRGTNALANAIRDAGKVRVLLERGDLQPSEPELRDALLLAIHDDVAELLVAHGADLEARDHDGLTPYSRAARRGDGSLMQLLARHGARIEVDPVAEWLGAVVRGAAPAVPRPELVAALRASDAELLAIMASAGEDAIVERLLDAGLPLDARGVDDGTALHYAGMWARPSTVALLLRRGADVDLAGGPHHAPGTALQWTAWGSRALPGAAGRGADYVAAARLLVAAGAAVTDAMVDDASDEVAEVLERGLEP
jgi:ankyrin repeat protein